MERGIIYMAESPSGKRYIGKTERSLQDRILEHRGEESGCPLLAKAIAKYGDGVKFCVIAEPPLHCLDEFERFYIRELDTMSPRGYNLREGGDGGKLSDETRARISASLTGHSTTPAARAKISAGNKGKRYSAETRAKISAAKKGWEPSSETRAKMSAAHKGKTLSPEVRAKVSAGLRHYHSNKEETRKWKN